LTLFWLGVGIGALGALAYLLIAIVPGLVKDFVVTCIEVWRAIVRAFREEGGALKK
jgi:hypothetical protein